MSRLLAIIALVVATSPAFAEPFYNSLRALANQCQYAVYGHDIISRRAVSEMELDYLYGHAVCTAYLMGVKSGLPFDESKPAVMCIKRLTASGNELMRAFAHYYSTLQKTGAGQKILRVFEGSPGQFTVRALGAIYGCTHNQRGFAAAGTRIKEQREQAPADIDVSGLTPIEEELNFDDLIPSLAVPKKKPR